MVYERREEKRGRGRRRWSSFERLLVCDYFIWIPDISPLKAEDGVMKLFTKVSSANIYTKRNPQKLLKSPRARLRPRPIPILDPRLKAPPITILDPAIQRHLLNHRAKPLGPLCFALARADGLARLVVDLRRAVRVLDVEDGFAVGDERRKGGALGVLDALLVDGEGDVGEHGGDDGAGVLEARRHVVAGGFGGEEVHEGDGVGLGEA